MGIVDHTTRDYFVAAPVFLKNLCDPLSVAGIDWEDSDVYHIKASLSVVFSLLSGFTQPQRNMRWLHRLLHHRYKMLS